MSAHETYAVEIAGIQRDLRLFEQGRVYAAHEGRILEEERTGLLITG